METVLEMEPVAAGLTVPVSVMVTLFPEARIKPFHNPVVLL